MWNPAFDVAPGVLITGIITEQGLIDKASSGAFDVPGFLDNKGQAKPASSIPGFFALDTETVKDYLASHQGLAARIGPAEGKASWKVRGVLLFIRVTIVPVVNMHCPMEILPEDLCPYMSKRHVSKLVMFPGPV